MNTIVTKLRDGPVRTLADDVVGVLAWFGNLAKIWVTRFAKYRERRMAIEMLNGFDDHQLKDIGLTRGEIEFAVYGLYPRGTAR